MTYAFIQARMGSTRLPGKVMREIAGKPMLQWVVKRAQRIPGVDAVKVLTTPASQDIKIWDWCREHQIPVVCGPLEPLNRFREASQDLKSDDLILRLTADCPLLDPAVSMETLDLAKDAIKLSFPLTYNTRDWPDGLDTEVFPQWLLEEAHRRATHSEDREHVTLWMRQVYPQVSLPCDYPLRHLKWSVDTEADLSFVQTVYRTLGPDFGWKDVLNLKVGDVCGLCWDGVPHAERSYTSIGGKRDYILYDLHEVEDRSGAGIVECPAGALHAPNRLTAIGGCQNAAQSAQGSSGSPHSAPLGGQSEPRGSKACPSSSPSH